MRKTLRVLAALLGYPNAGLRSHLIEIRELLIEEGVLSTSRQLELVALIDTLRRADPLVAEAAYVELFDRGRATSLHLFEHVHGDSPDYLPAVLEFVSTQPPREARAFLAEMAHIFNAIFGALQQRESAYASVLGALLDLAGEKAQPVKPVVDESLDESWAEPVVFDGCSTKGQAKPGQEQAIHIVRGGRPPQGASA
jgi:nitrate reductase delta subunit